MCFNATASFVASGGLITVGAASLAISKKEYKVAATVPLLFGIQQGIEGFQWLALNHGAPNCIAGYSYSVFAFLLWPVLVPFAVWTLDKNRKAVLQWLLGLGSLLSAFLLYSLIRSPLEIDVVGRSIRYAFAPLGGVAIAIYLIVTCGALMSSSRKEIQLFGVLALASAGVAALISKATFASTWCFFAAVLSSAIFIYIWREQNRLRDSSSVDGRLARA